MAKLCEVISAADNRKNETDRDLTNLYHLLQKPDLISGLSRTYRPLDEDGERFPSESKLVQFSVADVLSKASAILTNLFDVVATQDSGNTLAKADVIVDGNIILKDVSVTTLLFLEKKLTDIHTVFNTLPVLPPEMEWTIDPNRGCYVSKPVETAKTKKLPYRLVKYEATKEHPAQVDVLMEDKVVGYWTKIEFSGALSAEQKTGLVDRVRKLREAVIQARQRANTTEVKNVSIGKSIFEYLLDPA